MCLIAYSPEGELIPRAAFDSARRTNPDGIGVMSSLGVEKFMGRKSGKRAWRYLRSLAQDSIPYGLHFRWATHGSVTRDNCHPFTAPASDAIVMHNGVFRQTAKRATNARSDTALFVEQFMAAAPAPDSARYGDFVRRLEKFIDRTNLLLIFHRRSAEFTICNEREGEWIDGLWYSNAYSLPYEMSPWQGSALSKLDDAPIKSAARWAELDRLFPLPKAGDEYADRNVSDAVTRSVSDDYYAQVENENGYLDDGAELGARAASRAMIDGPDRDYLDYLRRAGIPLYTG